MEIGEEKQIAQAFVLLVDGANKATGYKQIAELDPNAVFDYLRQRDIMMSVQHWDWPRAVNLETLLRAEELPEEFKLALGRKHVENLTKDINQRAAEDRKIGAMWTARFYHEAFNALYALAGNKTFHEGTRLMALTEIVDKMVPHIYALSELGNIKSHMTFLHGIAMDAEQPVAIRQVAEQGLGKGATMLADAVDENLGRSRINDKMVCEGHDIAAFLMSTEYLPADVKLKIWNQVNKAFGDNVLGDWVPDKGYQWANVSEDAKARIVSWLAENNRAPVAELFKIDGLPEKTKLKLVERLEKDTAKWCERKLEMTVPYSPEHRRYVNEFVEKLEGLPDNLRWNEIKTIIKEHAERGLFTTVIDFANDADTEIADYARTMIGPAASRALEIVDAAFDKCVLTMWDKGYWPGLGGTYTLAKMKEDTSLPENVRNAAKAMIEKIAEKTFETVANIYESDRDRVLRDLALAPHAPMEYRIKAGMMVDVNWIHTGYPEEVRITAGLRAVERDGCIPRLAEIAVHRDVPREVRIAARRKLGIEKVCTM